MKSKDNLKTLFFVLLIALIFWIVDREDQKDNKPQKLGRPIGTVVEP